MNRDSNSRRGDDVREAPHAVLEIHVMVQLAGQDSLATETVLLPLDKAEARMRSGQTEALRGIKPFSVLTAGDDLAVGLGVSVRGAHLVGEDDVIPDDAPASASDSPSSDKPADAGMSTDREAQADSLTDRMGGE